MTRRNAAGEWKHGRPPNLGAVIGLAAGAVGAAARQHRKVTPKPDEPQMKQTLG